MHWGQLGTRFEDVRINENIKVIISSWDSSSKSFIVILGMSRCENSDDFWVRAHFRSAGCIPCVRRRKGDAMSTGGGGVLVS